MSFGARLSFMKARPPGGATEREPETVSRRTTLGPAAGVDEPPPRAGALAERLASRAAVRPTASVAWVGPGFERRVYAVSSSAGWGAASRLPARLPEHDVPDARAIERAVTFVRTGDDPVAEHGAVFLDLETTGLGSAGRTLAFIVGMASCPAPDRIELVQWTLRAPAAERAMLRDVAATIERALDPGASLVTFNGASFDLPLLSGRLRRLGLEPPASLRRAPHLDLLHVARRLAGSELPDRRLSTLERAWLGIRRVGDLDGAEVARVFDQLLQRPDDPWTLDRLEQAQAHNRLDIVTLAMLCRTIAARLSDPPDAATAVRVAQHFWRIGRPVRALGCLRPWVEVWMEGAASEEQPAVVRDAAELLRRIGAPESAARLWSWLCVRLPGDVEAHEALAKDLEHRRRRPIEALAVAEASHAPCPRRLARLRRKVERQGVMGPAMAEPETSGVREVVAHLAR